MRIIGGSARGKKLIPPRDRSIRPPLDRIRESIFSVLGQGVFGARVLDLFAGTGSFGLEALSRGARHATFVDRSVEAARIIERNAENLGFTSQARVLCADAFGVPGPESDSGAFGLIFLDPPFPLFQTMEDAERVVSRVTDLLRGAETTAASTVILRYPSEYTEPLPFHGLSPRVYGDSTVVLLDERSLDPDADEGPSLA